MVTTRSKKVVSEEKKGSSEKRGLSKALENFKKGVIKVAVRNLKRELSESEIQKIEKDIADKAHILEHTPNHPPYASMIYTAIEELNEEGGSSEMSISNFIREKFPDLPWAHSQYLKLHLHKLCKNKEILLNSENLYTRADENAQNPSSFENDNSKEDVKKKGGRPRKRDESKKRKREKTNLGTSDLVPVQEEEDEASQENSQQMEELEQVTSKDNESCPVEHKQSRLNARKSNNEAASGAADEGSGPGGHSKTPLDCVENVQNIEERKPEPGRYSKTPLNYVVEKMQARQVKSTYRNKEPEPSSTSAMITDLANPDSQPLGRVTRGRLGRPRKNISSAEKVAENSENKVQQLDYVEDINKMQERQLKPTYRNKEQEHSSTSAMITNLTNPNSQPQGRVTRGRLGRPRINISSGEKVAENSENQEQRLDYVEDVNKMQEGQLKPTYRNKEPEHSSTSALITDLANPNSQSQRRVTRGRLGRPRENISSGEKAAENSENQEQPLDYVEEVYKMQERQLKPTYQNKDPEHSSTSALITDLSNRDSQPQGRITRGRLRRPRKTISSGEKVAENSKNQEQPLDYVEDVNKMQERQLKSAYRNKDPEHSSTSALITDLANRNSQPQGRVTRGRLGRPRENISSEEKVAENFENQQQPKRLGRPRKGDNLQSQQQPRRLGRPRKTDTMQNQQQPRRLRRPRKVNMES